MKNKDFIKGEYYTTEWDGYTGTWKFLAWHEDKERPFTQSVNNADSDRIRKASHCPYLPGRETRPATEKEIQWLNKCLETGIYTDLNKIVPHESIYPIFN